MNHATTVSRDQACQDAKNVRWFWNLGRSSTREIERFRRREPSALRYGRCDATYRAEAKRLGLDADRAAKARRFFHDFTNEEVDKLSEMIIRERSRFSFT